MDKKIILVGIVSVVAFVAADYLEPKIAGWLKLSPDNAIGVKAVKWGVVAGLAMASYWAIEKYA